MKYALLFEVGNNLMAVDVKKIKQVLRKKKITPIPQAPKYLDGVVIHRESVIPVVNIAKKINKEPGVGKDRIIIVNISNLLIGFRVDNVLEVVDTKDCKIDEAEEKELIKGTLKYKDNKIIVLIEPDNLFSEKERKAIEKIQ